MQVPRKMLPLLGVLTLGACAVNPQPGHGARNAAQFVTWPTLRAPDGTIRRCGTADLPRTLPAAAALVDSAALAGHPSGVTVFSLLFGQGGEVLRSRIIQSDLPAPAQDELAAAFGRLLRPQAEATDRWGVQVRVKTGAEVSIEVDRQEFCDYTIDRRASLPAPGAGIADFSPVRTTAGDWAAGATRSSSFVVDTLGNMIDPRVDTPAHMEYLMGLRYLPALIDRIPVAVLVEY